MGEAQGREYPSLRTPACPSYRPRAVDARSLREMRVNCAPSPPGEYWRQPECSQPPPGALHAPVSSGMANAPPYAGIEGPEVAEYAEFMSVLALALHPLRVPARQTIITQGETQDAVYFVLSGSVVELGPSGEPVRYHREKSFFGESYIMFRLPSPATFQSTSDCELYRLSASQLAGMTAAYPLVHRYMGKVARARLLPSTPVGKERPHGYFPSPRMSTSASSVAHQSSPHRLEDTHMAARHYSSQAAAAAAAMASPRGNGVYGAYPGQVSSRPAQPYTPHQGQPWPSDSNNPQLPVPAGAGGNNLGAGAGGVRAMCTSPDGDWRQQQQQQAHHAHGNPGYHQPHNTGAGAAGVAGAGGYHTTAHQRGISPRHSPAHNQYIMRSPPIQQRDAFAVPYRRPPPVLVPIPGAIPGKGSMDAAAAYSPHGLGGGGGGGGHHHHAHHAYAAAQHHAGGALAHTPPAAGPPPGLYAPQTPTMHSHGHSQPVSRVSSTMSHVEPLTRVNLEQFTRETEQNPLGPDGTLLRYLTEQYYIQREYLLKHAQQQRSPAPRSWDSMSTTSNTNNNNVAAAVPPAQFAPARPSMATPRDLGHLAASPFSFEHAPVAEHMYSASPDRR